MFDIVSDLHIDQWDSSLPNLYPCGEISDFPYEFPDTESEYLIIAGDISDNIDLSVKYLDFISNNTKYQKILFVEGNHEHVHKYPNLYTHDQINKKIQDLNNDKLIYLPRNHFFSKNKDTVFIGFCGWWDYDNSNEKSIEENLDYFKQWIPHLSKEDSINFIENVINKSNEEYQELDKSLEKYSNDPNIKNVVIVTHTCPKKKFCNREELSSTNMNTKYNKLINKYPKISHWVFGHTHNTFELKSDNIHFICNPRGRPMDFDRKKYYVKTVDFYKKKSKL